MYEETTWTCANVYQLISLISFKHMHPWRLSSGQYDADRLRLQEMKAEYIQLLMSSFLL